MKQTRNIFLLAALAMLAGACVVNMDDEREPDPVTGEDDGRLVTLAIAVPGSAATRAEDPEGIVEAIDVLLFDKTTDEFRYRAIGSSITDVSVSTPDTIKKSFNVRLPIGEWGVVVLANARAAITDYPDASLLVPATLDESCNVKREEILNKLVMTLNPGTKWNKTKPFPMWGYYKTSANVMILDVNEHTPAITNAIALTRAVVRVDLSMTAAATANFSLASAHLYNYSTAGSLAPLAGDIAVNDGYNSSQWKNGKAEEPNVPGTVTPEEVPLDYTISSSPYEREIYTFEAAEGTPGVIENTCLVVGGYYQGGSSLTYYRVDFIDKVSKNHLALLRNHRYAVEIQEVNGHGYPGKDDAYKNKPANIVVNIVPWDEGGMNNVKFSGQHYLSVDKSEIVFYSNGAPKSMQAVTNFPGGWTLDSIPAWLEIAPLSSSTGNAKFTLEATATGVQEGYFYVVAGNLNKKIRVRQLDEDEFSLEILPSELTFYKSARAAKTVELFPFPAIGNGYSFALDATGNLEWRTGKSPKVPEDTDDILNPYNVLSIWPAANEIDEKTRGGSVLVTLKGPDGKAVTRVINVKQLGREMIFTPEGILDYPGAAGDYTFTVTSEAPWQLSKSDGYLTLGDEMEQPAATGYPYHFSLEANPAFVPRVATINVTSSDAGFYPPNRSFQIRQASAASYIHITNPSSLTHDFGDSDAGKKVEFTTNTKWKFIIDDATYSSVIKNTDGPVASTSYDLGASPLSPEDGSVTFTPETDAGMEVAGTKTTTVTFTTDPPTDDPKHVTFSRTIPAKWTFVSAGEGSTPLSDGSNISAAATTVRLTAEANLNWWGRVGIDDATKQSTTGIVTGYQSKWVDIDFLDRPVDAPASWTASGDPVTIQAGYDTQGNITGKTTKTLTLNRDKYDLTVESSSRTYNSVSLNVQTNAPWFELTLNLSSDNSEIGDLSGDKKGTYPVKIDPNIETTEREVNVLNKYTGEVVHTFFQPAAPCLYFYSVSSGFTGSCPGGYTKGNPTDAYVYRIYATGELATGNIRYWAGQVMRNGVVYTIYNTRRYVDGIWDTETETVSTDQKGSGGGYIFCTK